MTVHGFSLAVAGPKGADFLSRLIGSGRRPNNVFSYIQKGDGARSFESIEASCSSHGIPLHRTSTPRPHPEELFFFVGWQLKFSEPGSRLVVFHDSLLPKYRGFAPTVAALIAGDSEIGVTALAPVEEVDAGPIYGKKAVAVRYPLKIAAALKAQVDLMVALAIELLDRSATGALPHPAPQSEPEATYSIWRDDLDYTIDFNRSACELVRFIHAVGHPYLGASCAVNNQTVRVLDAETVEDLNFVERAPGKVWHLDSRGPVVVCGRGLIRLTDLRKADGSIFLIEKLRTRFVATH